MWVSVLMRMRKGKMVFVSDIKGMWVCECLLRSCGCVELVSDIKGMWVRECLLKVMWVCGFRY